uniref:Uncharacterized protein n=1 Tax=Romanomermis culicivorax TaxID=13658 RepID=A0A915JG87_ROMCU
AKERARTTVETPQEIVGNVVTGIHTNVAALLPRKDSLKRTVRNVRQDQNLPALPRDVENLVIPQSHQEIVIDGVAQQFLMYDSGQQLLPSRMLVFATRHSLQLLAQNVE